MGCHDKTGSVPPDLAGPTRVGGWGSFYCCNLKRSDKLFHRENPLRGYNWGVAPCRNAASGWSCVAARLFPPLVTGVVIFTFHARRCYRCGLGKQKNWFPWYNLGQIFDETSDVLNVIWSYLWNRSCLFNLNEDLRFDVTVKWSSSSLCSISEGECVFMNILLLLESVHQWATALSPCLWKCHKLNCCMLLRTELI